MPKLDDLTGKKFGRLTVIKRAERREPHRGAFWLCKCDCGNEKVISGNALKTTTKSCGCLNRENAVEKGKSKYKHRMTGTRLYNIWSGIKTRCYNSKCKIYKYYGGNGIEMCKEWKDDFISFYDWATKNGYTKNLSIDRIDVNGNYEPSNCRWATHIEQANNTSKNKRISIGGEEHTLHEWLRIKNINRGTYYRRIEMGWDVVSSIMKPPKPKKMKGG